jgi:hypothetical protein
MRTMELLVQTVMPRHMASMRENRTAHTTNTSLPVVGEEQNLYIISIVTFLLFVGPVTQNAIGMFNTN